MKKDAQSAVAKKFNMLDFHDDALISVRIHPPVTRDNSTAIDFQFLDDSTRKKKKLSFHNCGNLRFIMDFDVLADQWVFGTEKSNAQTDVARMKKFIMTQKRHWRVEYMPPSSKDKPIRKKIASLSRYTLFRITFFGGTAEVLARNFELETSAK